MKYLRSDISDLKHLKHLDLSENLLTSVNPEELKDIEKVYLYDNKITTDLSELKNIIHVDYIKIIENYL